MNKKEVGTIQECRRIAKKQLLIEKEGTLTYSYVLGQLDLFNWLLNMSNEEK